MLDNPAAPECRGQGGRRPFSASQEYAVVSNPYGMIIGGAHSVAYVDVACNAALAQDSSIWRFSLTTRDLYNEMS